MLKKLFTLLSIATIVFQQAKAQQWNGYTLYSIQNSSAAYLMDTFKNTFHSWTGLSANTGYSCHMEPGGTIVRASKATTGLPSGAPGGPICGKVQKHDYSGNLVWDYAVTGTNMVSHHDICPMPNGNVLVIAYERKSSAEVTAAGANNAIEMWPDMILEIQPTGLTTGTVVWEWHTWDHLVQNVSSSKANYQTSILQHPELMNINYKQAKDWQHMNGIDYNPILDQIAFSSHNLNEWYIIDHSTTTAEAASHLGGNSGKGGDILYRWGNPAAYGASGTAILNVTHDAHWIPEGVPNAGRLAGYNNKGVSNSQSSADQIEVPLNGYNYDIVLGQAFLPASYTDRKTFTGLYSSNMGSTQQLPNGNELICEAIAGTITELNSNGVQVMQKVFSGAVPQAKKYDSCFIFNTPPAIPLVSSNGTNLSSTSATTYQWYKNGVQISGANSQTYTPTTSGIYLVRITDANGCVYQYSKGFKYDKLPNSIDDNFDISNQIDIYPNPSTGIIYILHKNLLGTTFQVYVYDSFGRLIVETNEATSAINLSSLGNGLYTIQLIGKQTTASKKIVLSK